MRLSERKQTSKVACWVMPCVRNIPTGNSIETESRLEVAKSWGQGRVGRNCSMVRGFTWGDETILELDRAGGGTT